MVKVKKAKELEYGEVRVSKTFGLTPTGARLFRELAEGLGVSSSQLIEKIARREVEIATPLGEFLTN